MSLNLISSSCLNNALLSTLTFPSKHLRLFLSSITRGLISINAKSFSINNFERFLKISINCFVCSLFKFNPRANLFASSSEASSSIFTEALKIFSGLFSATSSMLTPPSGEAITTIDLVDLSTTMPR